jgi:DHA1 family bicyclomycin/chloramphenicol resistance-like MFS transporter
MRPTKALGLPEFVAMMAVLFATLAFSIDAMLPALPEIARELSPDAPNRAQLIVLSFVLGMGVGTVVTGPLSDAFGRKPVISFGIALYILGALLAYFAQTLELVLAARVIQGLGAASPRIVPMAMMRDMYEGRRMAQITSFVMTVFMLVPAVAPSIGALIIHAAGWRYIFAAFIVFALIGGLWINLRQPETLPPEDRRPLSFTQLRLALAEVTGNRMVMLYTAVLTLGFTQMMGLISSTQPIYDQTYGQAANFPLWFALSALIAATGTILNARLVMTVGMRRLALLSYAVQTVFAATFLVAFEFGLIPPTLAFPVWFFWSVSVFFMAGLTFGNLNALALQPMGHIAGMAASVIAAISTVLSVILAIPIGQAFNGTPAPLLIGTMICSGLCWLLMTRSNEIDDLSGAPHLHT